MEAVMKSYYSIMLLIVFAFVMSIMAVVAAAMHHTDLSTSEGAIVALAICSALLAYRLAQAEKRVAHLEDRLENLIQHLSQEKRYAHPENAEQKKSAARDGQEDGTPRP